MKTKLTIFDYDACTSARLPCKQFDCRMHIGYGDKDGKTCTLQLADDGGMSLTDIAALMGVSRERIRQIESVALRKVQDALARRGIKEEDERPTPADLVYARKMRTYTPSSPNSAPEYSRPLLGRPSKTDDDEEAEHDEFARDPGFFHKLGDADTDTKVVAKVWAMFGRRWGIRSLNSIRGTKARATNIANGIESRPVVVANVPGQKDVFEAMRQLKEEGLPISKDAILNRLSIGIAISGKMVQKMVNTYLKSEAIRKSARTIEPLPVPKLDLAFRMKMRAALSDEGEAEETEAAQTDPGFVER